MQESCRTTVSSTRTETRKGRLPGTGSRASKSPPELERRDAPPPRKPEGLLEGQNAEGRPRAIHRPEKDMVVDGMTALLGKEVQGRGSEPPHPSLLPHTRSYLPVIRHGYRRDQRCEDLGVDQRAGLCQLRQHSDVEEPVCSVGTPGGQYVPGVRHLPSE